MHGKDLVVGLGIHECRLWRRELYASQHAEHAANREEHKCRRHEAYADDSVVDRRKALQSRAGGPDLLELAVQSYRRAALWRVFDRGIHCATFPAASGLAI